MSAGAVRRRVVGVQDETWSGEVSNQLETIDQVTHLHFL